MATAGGFVIIGIGCEGARSPHQKLGDCCIAPSSMHGLQIALVVFQASSNLHMRYEADNKIEYSVAA